jgi:hypothetical protein
LCHSDALFLTTRDGQLVYVNSHLQLSGYLNRPSYRAQRHGISESMPSAARPPYPLVEQKGGYDLVDIDTNHRKVDDSSFKSRVFSNLANAPCFSALRDVTEARRLKPSCFNLKWDRWGCWRAGLPG